MTIFMELERDRSERVRYDYPDYPAYIRRGLLSHYPNYTAPSHWHDDVELIAVLSGGMDYNVNGQIIPLGPGGGIFINARQLHYGFSSGSRECEFFCILLHPSALCASPAFERSFVSPVTGNGALPFAVLGPGIPWQAEILGGIRQIYEEKDRPGAALRIQSTFCKIWALLYEQMPQNTPELPQAEWNSRQLLLLKEMIGFLQQHYAEKLTLADIAAAGHVCQSKCCALFRRYLSRTPMSYLTDYRLTRSAELLRNTDRSVTEIGYACGFTSASYYAETFRKWIGCSPKEYRSSGHGASFSAFGPAQE